MKADYEEKLGRAKEESEEILKNAVRRAQLREEEILREANEKATRVMKRAEEQVELEKKRAINEVKDEVSDMAIGIASAVLERDIDRKEHEALIDEFIRTMGEA
jgi:F-type H+-transporting ATPase subunit b